MDTVLAFLISNCCFIGIIGYGIDPIITKICLFIIVIRTLFKFWDLQDKKNLLVQKNHKSAEEQKEIEKIKKDLETIISLSGFAGIFFAAILVDSDSFKIALLDTSLLVCVVNSIFVIVMFFSKKKHQKQQFENEEEHSEIDSDDDFLDL